MDLKKRILAEVAIHSLKNALYYRLFLSGAVAYSQVMELLTPDEIVRLTPPERLALIAQLWDSLEEEHVPLTGEQQEEIESRLASLDGARGSSITWAALKAELERRCP